MLLSLFVADAHRLFIATRPGPLRPLPLVGSSNSVPSPRPIAWLDRPQHLGASRLQTPDIEINRRAQRNKATGFELARAPGRGMIANDPAKKCVRPTWLEARIVWWPPGGYTLAALMAGSALDPSTTA